MVVIPEFVMRMVEELDELNKRMDKLLEFMGSDEFNTLDKHKRMLVNIQWNAMSIYRSSLKERIDIHAMECN